MSVLAAMWCGPISDHSFFSVSPYFQVSDSWRGPGTVCVASSWEILISPAKLCPGGVTVTGVHAGSRGASCMGGVGSLGE